jgi:hypothetical protein
MEPMLGDAADAQQAFHTFKPFVNRNIWLGKMNDVTKRVRQDDLAVQAACDCIRAAQADREIVQLVNQLADEPKVRWKDSVAKAVNGPCLDVDPAAVELARAAVQRSITEHNQDWD